MCWSGRRRAVNMYKHCWEWVLEVVSVEAVCWGVVASRNEAGRSDEKQANCVKRQRRQQDATQECSKRSRSTLAFEISRQVSFATATQQYHRAVTHHMNKPLKHNESNAFHRKVIGKFSQKQFYTYTGLMQHFRSDQKQFYSAAPLIVC